MHYSILQCTTYNSNTAVYQVMSTVVDHMLLSILQYTILITTVFYSDYYSILQYTILITTVHYDI